MVLGQLLLGITVVAVVLLLLPFLLVMAGVGAAMLLWFVASAAVLGALVFWLVFPGTYGLAVLLLILVIGLPLVDRRSRHGTTDLSLARHRDRTDATHDPALGKSS